ncbi:hypothetical protein [uncultured Acetobacteroides sp.]|uniref:hypothetical protein n=1 Tax=uncultured Acetobacteroides sp. TaxID=1760811 RepID=UPI0029F4BF50|nr:hypothetical protein [uncultured Acetobacteroides sp.]
MQTFSFKGLELMLLNRTIVEGTKVNLIHRVFLALFTLFVVYFSVQIYLYLPQNLEVLVLYLLLFGAAILAIQKIIKDRHSPSMASISSDTIRVVRFKNHFTRIPCLFSSSPDAEFETHDGNTVKLRVRLEKAVLLQFKHELVKRDIRVEEH